MWLAQQFQVGLHPVQKEKRRLLTTEVAEISEKMPV